MLRSSTLIAALALGSIAAPALAAQTSTDLATVCKSLGDAKVGQWASFDVVGGRGETGGGSNGGKMRLAVVGSERAADTALYWFEVRFEGMDPSHSGVVQILTTSLAAGVASPRAVVIKWGPQPAMKVSGQMAEMMGQTGKDKTAAFDWAGRCSGAHVVGWESVVVPAGSFRALHVTTDDGADVWTSRDVPFGLVKTHGKQGDMALTARGADATSSITEKPIEMPGMMMSPPTKP
ncbi:MAG TPA: hypothetical protein VH137_03825 [Gemmatimonadales bacterium]|jgi:hypothetical protein|nr:hypothetical protein [Gemmatimonadales bacterium]